MRPRRLLAIVLLGISISSAARAEEPRHRRLSAVPFTEVKLQDDFWTPRLETNRTVSLPHNFEWCEKTGRINNFAKAGKLMDGRIQWRIADDSDVYKVLEGASYSLAARPDPVLERTVDGVISKIAAAQQPDGYLNTYYTMVEPDKRWANLKDGHELYCAGHLIEAAVAHFRATGKRTFLDVATKFADYIDSVFGPGKRQGTPGHEEIELALVKLYQATGRQKYLDLAKYFIDVRGDASRREIWGEYHQDHKPVREQSEIVGHAVRAMYLYAGTADAAAYSGDQKLIDAMNRLWRDMATGKIYLTGGIGARHSGEAFGDAYELPNDSAYCETCAAIGLVFWAHRMNLLHGDARYADIVERAAHNGVLSGIALDGRRFFYVNPLASAGKHHRQPFFSCACCPTNAVRFLPSLPGYAYATGDDGIFVNLYAAGKAKVALGDGAGKNVVTLTQRTKYPWDGHVRLSVEPQRPGEFALRLRIPGWCKGAALAIDGAPVKLDVQKGYATVKRTWPAVSNVELQLPMPVERIEANPRVAADAGRAAVQRGPIVYCFEAIDNDGRAKDIVLPRNPAFKTEHRKDLLGGVTVITGTSADGRRITAVPYYAWDHREPGEMAVWMRQEGMSEKPRTDDPAWNDILYRPLDAAAPR